MDLIEILRRILQTKNQLKSILGERDNISRYPVAIHNALASRYNAGYRVGYRDRYEELTEEEDGWVTGPEEILPYNLDDTYYEEFTTEILTDIMRDVLNYRIQMKDELNAWLDGSPVTDEFIYYPEWLSALLDVAYNAGLNGGSECADDDYEGDEDVDMPTAQFSNNKFEMSTSQSEASLWYKIDEDGIETRYTGPIIISDDCTIYYWAKIGRSKTGSSISCTWSSSGLQAFVYPCTFIQSGNYVKIETSTSGAVIEYKLDSSEWRSYYSPVLVNSNSTTLTARAFYQNEYSKKSYYNISHEQISSDSRPADVQCTFSASGGVVTVTLTCATPGATIYYNINESAGYYSIYSAPFTQSSNYFLVYVYSELNGVESPHRLVYKYDSSYSSSNTVDPVQFIGDYNGVTLYTTTSGASIWYRFGSSGEYQSVSQNQVSFNITSAVQIFAYATKSGMNPSPVTDYYYNPNGGSGYGGNGIPKPTMTLNGDVVTIYSPLTVRYTVDETDPRSSGGTVQVYNPDTGVKLTTTTTIKAVSVNSSGQFSEVAVGVFTPFSNITDGSSGSEWNPQNPGDNPGGTTDNTDWTNQDWFYVTGASGMSFNSGANPIYVSVEGSNSWEKMYGPNITLDPNIKYFIKGSLSNIYSFSGSATIGGDIRSLKTTGPTLVSNDIFTGFFKNCTGLVDAANLRFGATSTLPNQFKEFFSECTSLTAAPISFFTTINNILPSACERMFYNTSIMNSPSFTFNVIQSNGCKEMFSGCTHLSDAMNSKFVLTVLESSGLERCFEFCSNLVNCPTVEVNSSALNGCAYMFSGCASLTSVEKISLGRDLARSQYEGMFYNCTSLVSGPDLPATQAADSCYKEMFSGCSLLSRAGNISLMNLAGYCCFGMFRNCTSLIKAPALPAETLGMISGANGTVLCYGEMFMGCSNLSYIEAYFKTTPTTNHLDKWVRGVASSGIFVQGRDATWEVYGEYAIPEGWRPQKMANVGIIEDIWIGNDGLVYIKADRADSIYYEIHNEAVTDSYIPGPGQLYEGPFQIGQSCYIVAWCVNSDGDTGSWKQVYIEIKLPGLTISCSDNEVTIYTPYDYTYDNIKYQLYPIGDHSNPETNWITYTGPFKIEKSQSIAARGYTGSVYSDIYWADILYGVNAPNINFTSGGNRFHLSYPNENILKAMYYKIDDTTVDTDTLPSGWELWVDNGTDPVLESGQKIVTAIAKVEVDSVIGWSSARSKERSHTDPNEGLPVPFLRMVNKDESNDVILTIDGVDYYTWEKTSYKVKIYFVDNGYTFYYDGPFSTVLGGPYPNLNVRVVPIKCRVENGGYAGEWITPRDYNIYEIQYNPNFVEIEFDAPVINVDDNGVLTISNANMYIDNRDVLTYFRVDVQECEAGFNPQSLSGDYYRGYVPFYWAYNPTLDSRIKVAHIYAYSIVNGTSVKKWAHPGAEEQGVQPDPYIWTNEAFIDIEECDGPDITFDGRDIIMSNKYGLNVNYEFRAEDCVWGTNTVQTNIYDDWTLWSGISKTINANLGYGNFYARFYKSNGTYSKVSGPFEYYNPDVVTELLPPIPSVTNDDTNKLSFLFLQTLSPGTLSQFKIVGNVGSDTQHPDKSIVNQNGNLPDWWGGVIDKYKYDTWKTASLYGETLSEYLLQGYIVTRAWDGENESEEYGCYYYNNPFAAEGLGTPDIVMYEKTVGGQTVRGFRIVNPKRYTINWYYITDCEYDNYPTQAEKNAANTALAQVRRANIYENDFISITSTAAHLTHGVIHYYSSLGDSTTDELTYEFNFDVTIEITPPTIEVSRNTTGDSANYPFVAVIKPTAGSIANTNDFYFTRIKWKMKDIIWDTSSDVVPDSDTGTAYQKLIGDRYIIVEFHKASYSSISDVSIYVYIKKNILRGTIVAYQTDEMNNIQGWGETEYDSTYHRTEATQYFFDVENFN